MKVFITSLFFLIVSVVQGQIYDPVSFQSSVNKIDDTHYELLIKSIIEPGWHIYSQEVPAGGPVPTSFSFSNKEKYTLKGPVSEPEGHTVDDPVFEMRIKYFSDAATFKQVIERKTKDAFTIKASIDFMVCNDQSCLPPATKDVIFNIEAGLAVIEKKVKEESKQEVVATSNSGPQDELDTDSIENTEQEEVEDATGLNNSNDTVAKDKDSSIVVEKIIPESANSHDEVKEKTTDSRNLWSI